MKSKAFRVDMGFREVVVLKHAVDGNLGGGELVAFVGWVCGASMDGHPDCWSYRMFTDFWCFECFAGQPVFAFVLGLMTVSGV